MKNTKIEWAHHTFNPWIGCTKVSPGCDNCYAEADFDKRRHVVQLGPNQPRKRTAPSTWAAPLRWNAEAERKGVCESVFCASLGDWADNEVPSEWRVDLGALIKRTRNLIWLLLTKRIGNAKAMLAEMFPDGVPDNVWIGATITNQEEADRDIPKLMRVPAYRHFLSIEPMLGPIDLKLMQYEDSDHLDEQGRIIANTRRRLIGQVICGGESGPGARPMHPEWVRSLRDQCHAAGVPFFFKQWGEWVPYEDSAQPPFKWSQHGHEFDGHWLPDFESDDGQHQREWHCDWSSMLLARRVGKKAAGRLLDGHEWNEVPV